MTAILLLAAPARAEDDLKAKLEVCLACHGANGVSETEGVPSIAGQPDLYVQWQLVFFRGGRIKSEIMGAVAEPLSDEEVRAIGAAIAALPPAAPPPPAADDQPALTQAGAEIARGRRCGSCHGDGFRGQQAAARLAGQREEVLVKALQDYKAGTRTGTGIASMPEVAYRLTEDEIKAVAHYLARLR